MCKINFLNVHAELSSGTEMPIFWLEPSLTSFFGCVCVAKHARIQKVLLEGVQL